MRTLYFILFALLSVNAFGQCADITLPAQSIYCSNDALILTVGNGSSSSFTYQWFFNNYLLSSGTNNTLRVLGTGDYRVDATFTDGTVCSASTTVSILVAPVALENIVYSVQDTDCDGFTSFDLITKNPDYIAGNTNYSVQYFPTRADARNNTNEITSIYINVIPVKDTVGVRVTDITTGCFDITHLKLSVIPLYTITSAIANTLPVDNNNVIEICDGESVTFTAVYDPNHSYTWDFESLGRQTGQTVTQQFDQPGGYFVRLLTTDQNSCPSAPVDYVTVVVSQDPNINYVAIDNPVICLGNSLDVVPESTNGPILVCDDADFVAGTNFLPDGNGVSYITPINIDCFPEGAILNNTSSFLGVCMNIEHSYLGDLEMELIAPDGTILTLLASFTGQSTYLGEPIDDDSDLTPGVGYDYCFTTAALESFIATASLNTTIPPGDYSTNDPFSNLLGVPLNGAWSLRITDNLPSDNGYIFSWFMKFGADLESAIGYTSPAITSESWVAHPDIITLSTGGVTITPSQTGTNCYDYNTTDANGCTFTDQYCIEVRDPQTDFLAVDLYIYDSDANGTEDFNLAFNTDRLIGNMNPVTTVINYYTTLVDAQSQNNPIANPSSFANTTNPQTIYAVVKNTRLLCQNVAVDFELVLTSQPVTDSDNDTIPDLSEDLNGNGDLTDDDTDMDGIPNYLDNDDDGDGVPTALETNGVGARGTNFFYLDTDGDGIENYLDNDDDGDGLLTLDEDYNGNGDPTDDDTDGSGIPDFLESNVTLSTESLSSDNIVVYPNPFYEDRFEIRYSRIKENELMIHLYNMNGASIFKQKFQINSSGTLKIETPSLSSGVYFLQIGSDKNSVFKLIKK